MAGGIAFIGEDDTIYDGSPQIIGCTITNNRTTDSEHQGLFDRGGGAGIFVHNIYSIMISDSTVTYNIGMDYGGGIALRTVTIPVITDSVISYNENNGEEGGEHGGGIYMDGSGSLETDERARFENCTIANNKISVSAAAYGAGMYITGESYATVQNCTFSGNEYTGTHIPNGLGLTLGGSNVIVRGCTFSGHIGSDSSLSVGLGVRNLNTSLDLSDCTFSGNEGHTGVAISVESNEGSHDINISRCRIINNTALSGYGSMVAVRSETATIENCQITDNAGGNGIYIQSAHSPSLSEAKAYIKHTTIANNGRYGIWTHYGIPGVDAEFDITNSIVWGNFDSVDIDATGDNIATYSDIQNGTGEDWFGEGCIDTDPQFADPDNGDYHLSSLDNSPCIDTGTDIGITTDLDGNHRPKYQGYDMGCYENQTKMDIDTKRHGGEAQEEQLY